MSWFAARIVSTWEVRSVALASVVGDIGHGLVADLGSEGLRACSTPSPWVSL
jgi:hypothetical protein